MLNKERLWRVLWANTFYCKEFVLELLYIFRVFFCCADLCANKACVVGDDGFVELREGLRDAEGLGLNVFVTLRFFKVAFYLFGTASNVVVDGCCRKNL